MNLMLQQIIVAVLSAYITVQLSMRKFRAEKWWEIKSNSYSSILRSLHQMKRFYSEELLQNSGPDEYQADLQRKWREGFDNILVQADIGTFAISKKAAREIDILIQAESKISGSADKWYEEFDEFSMVLDECLKKLRKLARKDLGG